MSRPIAILTAPDEMTEAYREGLARVREQFDVVEVPQGASPEVVIALVHEHQARGFRDGMSAISESMGRAIEDARRPPVAIESSEIVHAGSRSAKVLQVADDVLDIADMLLPFLEGLGRGSVPVRVGIRVARALVDVAQRSPGTRARRRWKRSKRAGRRG